MLPSHYTSAASEGLFIAGTVLLAVAVGFLLAHNMPPIIPFVMLQSGLLALLWAGQQYAAVKSRRAVLFWSDTVKALHGQHEPVCGLPAVADGICRDHASG